MNLDSATNYGTRKGMANGLSFGILYLVMFASYGLAFWYGSKLVRDGSYSGGQIITVSSWLVGHFMVLVRILNNQNTARF